MTEDEKEAIVRDLINLTPRNEYTEEQIFDLELHSSYAVDLYIYKLFYHTSEGYQSWHTSQRLSGMKAGVHKRRMNRVWERICPTVQKMWREGSKGIYAVKTGKYAGSISLGHIYALDKQSALEIANTCFQYMVEKDERIFVSFVSIAGPEKISKFNEPIERKLRDRQKHIEEVVASSEEDLEQIKLALNALEISENIMKKM